jgi:hypothetical protein
MNLLRISGCLIFSCWMRIGSRDSSLYQIPFWLLVFQAYSPSTAFAYSSQGQFTAISRIRAAQGPPTNVKSVLFQNWIHSSQDRSGGSPRSGFVQRPQTFRPPPGSSLRLDMDQSSKRRATAELPPEQFDGPYPARRKDSGRLDRASPQGNGGHDLLSFGQSSLRAAFGNPNPSPVQPIRAHLKSRENSSTIKLPPDLRIVNSCPLSGMTLTPFSGTISGGSSGSRSGSKCTWTIAPPNETALKLSFQSFRLQQCCEYLEIFQCTNQYCDSKTKMAAPVAGSYIPAPIISTTGVIQIVFTSSFRPDLQFGGFEVSYSTLCPSNSYGEVVAGPQDCKPCRTSCVQGKQLSASCAHGASSDNTQSVCPLGFFSENLTSPCKPCNISCAQGGKRAHFH